MPTRPGAAWAQKVAADLMHDSRTICMSFDGSAAMLFLLDTARSVLRWRPGRVQDHGSANGALAVKRYLDITAALKSRDGPRAGVTTEVDPAVTVIEHCGRDRSLLARCLGWSPGTRWPLLTPL